MSDKFPQNIKSKHNINIYWMKTIHTQQLISPVITDFVMRYCSRGLTEFSSSMNAKHWYAENKDSSNRVALYSCIGMYILYGLYWYVHTIWLVFVCMYYMVSIGMYVLYGLYWYVHTIWLIFVCTYYMVCIGMYELYGLYWYVHTIWLVLVCT